MVKYTKKAQSAATFACMRGVTDFTNAAQFNLFESGYAHLYVIAMPKWIDTFGTYDNDVKKMADTFKYILEYEFKGLDGIDDINTDKLEVTDGVSTLNVIGKVTKQSSAEVTMSFTEKSGSVITNFIKFYLEGIKDPRSQAKTYHGLIRAGKTYGGFENEVFTLLYVVTDNTMLQLEKAYLLCNAWPTTARTNIYNVTKGEIDKKDIDVVFECFVLDGPDVDKRARDILAYTNETDAVANAYMAHDLLSAETVKPLKSANIGSIGNNLSLGEKSGVDGVIHLGSQEMTSFTIKDADGNEKDGLTDGTFSYVATNDSSDLYNYYNTTEKK